jgi:hypothetical protein
MNNRKPHAIRTCYYCGAPKYDDEHVPPQSFLVDGITAQSYYLHVCYIMLKSSTDQAILKAMLIPIAAVQGTDWLKCWYSAHPECVAWLLAQQGTITHHMHATVAVPIHAERGMEDFPTLAHAQINFERWIQATTAGIVYAVSGKCKLQSVDWDQTKVVCWDVMFRRRDDVPSTYDITTHGQWRTQEYANTYADYWLDGRFPQPYKYPVDHYRYRIGFSGYTVTIEHIFFNQYKFWCTFYPDFVDYNRFFAGHESCVSDSSSHSVHSFSHMCMDAGVD